MKVNQTMIAKSPFSLMFFFCCCLVAGQTKKQISTSKTVKANLEIKKSKSESIGSMQDTVLKTLPIKDSIRLLGTMTLKLYQQNGQASYYADKFTGRRTASGKIFNNQQYTCAHKKLPFGTKLKVTCERTKKSTIVEVTDRGPFVRGRDIDLSKRSFMDIAPSTYGGSIAVTIEIIKK